MGRDTAIQVYLSDENAAWLKEQAEAGGQSCSKYCREVILDYIDREHNERPHRRYAVDQQIELVLNQLEEEAMSLLEDFQSETGAKLDRLQRLRTVYAIATWRLVKRSYPLEQRKAAMKSAVDQVGLAPTHDPEIQTEISSFDSAAEAE
ncbi:hypothetical protein NDI56_21120 [Haloarcula sp. S1CR25-12]|uniref:Ribbon-helix-helix protein, CopG family n=1 Tax=Haloarcula saliterrae TaxID=2950534 RepID=A0ABU2FI44_9EURY|nr:hypothetical protein [Haloarcula sp. S1CR25-12]MDS0261911.1 hypothetical protein [Haloarcula sp. S1CR25-12]